MWRVTCQDGILRVHRHQVVNLKEPFARITDRRIRKQGKAHMTLVPSQTFTATRRPRAYTVQFTERMTGALYVAGSRRLQSQLLYETNRHVSEVFRAKALHHVLTTLDADTEPYEAIRFYLQRVLRAVCGSFPFDAIVTDIPTLATLELDLPVLYPDWQLVKVPQQLSMFSTYAWLVDLLLREYGMVPLQCLDWRVLRDIGLKHTNVRLEHLGSYKHILILVEMNKHYAGFLARELRQLGLKEVLPVTLFGVNRCKRSRYE